MQQCNLSVAEKKTGHTMQMISWGGHQIDFFAAEIERRDILGTHTIEKASLEAFVWPGIKPVGHKLWGLGPAIVGGVGGSARPIWKM